MGNPLDGKGLKERKQTAPQECFSSLQWAIKGAHINRRPIGSIDRATDCRAEGHGLKSLVGPTLRVSTNWEGQGAKIASANDFNVLPQVCETLKISHTIGKKSGARSSQCGGLLLLLYWGASA